MNLTLVSHAAQVLEDSGYRRLPTPVIVRGTPFDFGLVLLSPNDSSGIVLAGNEEEPAADFVRRAQAFSIALDLSGSRRSISVIADAQDELTEDGLLEFARVIPLTSLADLREEIASLLPLAIPQTQSVLQDPLEESLGHLAVADRSALEDAGLVDASYVGTAAVSEAFAKWIVEPIEEGEVN